MAADGEEVFYVMDTCMKIRMGLFFAALFFIVQKSMAQPPFAVAELFTSEGCVSCPPADKVLSELKAEAEKNKQNIYFLEYHVDYWNRLGWKDPFSKNQFTLRQENYSRVLPGKELYTPQLVINGEAELTGSDKKTAETAIRNALARIPGLSVSIDSRVVVNDTLVVSYTLSKADKNASVKIGITEDRLESNVVRGENAGKKLMHDAVVLIFYSSQAAEAKGTVKIPLKGFVPKAGMQLVALVQQKQTMKILGATRVVF
jgi:hypothetical protein